MKKKSKKDQNLVQEKNQNLKENHKKVLPVQELDTVKIVKNLDQNLDPDIWVRFQDPLGLIQEKGKAIDLKIELREDLMMNMIIEHNKGKCICHHLLQPQFCLLEGKVYPLKLMFMLKI